MYLFQAQPKKRPYSPEKDKKRETSVKRIHKSQYDHNKEIKKSTFWNIYVI